MSGFTWLHQLFVWLAKWIPRPFIVRATYRGVRFDRHGGMSVIEPGFRVYWPICTEIRLVPVTRRAWEFGGKRLADTRIETTLGSLPGVLVGDVVVTARVTDVLAQVGVFSLSPQLKADLGVALRAWDTTIGLAGNEAAVQAVLSARMVTYGLELDSFSIHGAHSRLAVVDPRPTSWREDATGDIDTL